MAGLWPNRGLRNVGESGYSMAKFGAIALTRSFSQNDIFSKDGVKAVALCPWYIIFFSDLGVKLTWISVFLLIRM